MSKIAVTYLEHMGSDLSTVNAARVSFGKKSFGETIEYDIFRDDPDTIKASVAKYKAEGWIVTSDVDDWKIVISRPLMGDIDLIKYLGKHKHISPFGHAFASFHVKAPIFVARQLVKHKFLRWNEVSRRYVDEDPVYYLPEEWRGRSADKKQGSDGFVEGVWDLNVETGALHEDEYGDLIVPYESVTTCPVSFIEAQMQFYRQLLDFGVAPEQARMVLPQSTMTEWVWSGSLDAFAAMCNLRCASDTQYESRIVADQISEKMSELFPVSWKALTNG